MKSVLLIFFIIISSIFYVECSFFNVPDLISNDPCDYMKLTYKTSCKLSRWLLNEVKDVKKDVTYSDIVYKTVCHKKFEEQNMTYLDLLINHVRINFTCGNSWSFDINSETLGDCVKYKTDSLYLKIYNRQTFSGVFYGNARNATNLYIIDDYSRYDFNFKICLYPQSKNCKSGTLMEPLVTDLHLIRMNLTNLDFLIFVGRYGKSSGPFYSVYSTIKTGTTREPQGVQCENILINKVEGNNSQTQAWVILFISCLINYILM
jgi:hypothetical protein